MNDFFISYTSADRDWAQWIAWQLEEAGYTTLLQAWDFRPGANFVQEMYRVTAEADRTIVILSPDYIMAGVTHPEWVAAFAQDPAGMHERVLPIRVRDTSLQDLFPSIVYIDLVGLTEQEATEAILSGIRRERAKPAAPPAFPQAMPRALDQPRFPGTLKLKEASETERTYVSENPQYFSQLTSEGQNIIQSHIARDIQDRLTRLDRSIVFDNSFWPITLCVTAVCLALGVYANLVDGSWVITSWGGIHNHCHNILSPHSICVLPGVGQEVCR